LDNVEAFKLQSIKTGNCRFCTQPKMQFYKFNELQQILQEERRNKLLLQNNNNKRQRQNNGLPLRSITSSKGNKQILQEYVLKTTLKHPFRDSYQNSMVSYRSSLVWFKTILHNKSIIPTGLPKMLQLSNNEKMDLDYMKRNKLQPWYNPLRNQFPLLSSNNNLGINSHILPVDMCFPPDKLHTHGKGGMEYNFRYMMAIILLISRKYPLRFRHNLAELDHEILNFNIYQSASVWGLKVERRLPGLSCK